MFKEFKGFQRVFTILARGYMWDGDEPDADRGYRAMQAWYSLPKEIQPKTKKAGQDKTCFAEWHGEFPELVDENSEGWCYRHVHNVIDAVLDNADKVTKATFENAFVLTKGFDAAWCKKVMQFQASLYSRKTESWVLRFNDIISEAKALGKLRNKDVNLPAEKEQKLISALPDKKRADVVITLAKYYLANKQDDSEWVVLPVENFVAYFGTTSFDRKWLPALPESVIVCEEYSGVCSFLLSL